MLFVSLKAKEPDCLTEQLQKSWKQEAVNILQIQLTKKPPVWADC